MREVFLRFEKAGVDQLSLIVTHGALPHEAVMETIELIGTKVLPDFLERDVDFTAAKHTRLAGALETVQARAPQPRAADPDYTFSAPAKAWGSDQAATEMSEALRGLENK